MHDLTHLSPCQLASNAPIKRDCPRPVELRNERFAHQFDAETLFYDVYRVGRDVVFQGPPLFNFADYLREANLFKGKFRRLFPKARLVERNRANEIWLRTDSDKIDLSCDLGQFSIDVQPNHADFFAGKRVIHTLSKDNDIRWIEDWIRFYVAVHSADAVLFYDNGSSVYTAPELQQTLRATFPQLAIIVVSWPFKYGPQGGEAGAVGGVEAPWDSDYCQTGSMQHARFRFLMSARSILNVDIDELVLSNRGRSIFEATEQSREKYIRFPGTWISSTCPRPVTVANCRHGDFTLRDAAERETCPPKWCIVPEARFNAKFHWSVHNVFGSKHNRMLSDEFVYRHMKGISNNWKYDRWDSGDFDPSRFAEDNELRAAFAQAGLLRD
jgi:hypothetical protein